MADHNDSQSKGANSAVDNAITDRTTVEKNSEGKFVSENLLLMFHITYHKQKLVLTKT